MWKRILDFLFDRCPVCGEPNTRDYGIYGSWQHWCEKD